MQITTEEVDTKPTKYNDYIKEFVKYYKLDGLTEYVRCSGRNLYYKKLLIYILRQKFRLSYPQIAKIFRNNHATIMFHYNDVCDNPELQEAITDAWDLYKNK